MANQQGCLDGAFAITGFTLRDPDVTQQSRGDLYYSPACKAMWGDFTVYETYSPLFPQLWTQPEYGGVNQLAASTTMYGPGNFTTAMVDWQQSVKFCASHNGVDPDMDWDSQGYNACTGWR
ncbi:hypothetical protein [Micromonospora sp. NPDC051296]|uniref:hypothetical protein n=1 Tax=Micromonospora sp. NPDC051296 TaxID=3155046 RepID=UPI00342C4EEA